MLSLLTFVCGVVTIPVALGLSSDATHLSLPRLRVVAFGLSLAGGVVIALSLG